MLIQYDLQGTLLRHRGIFDTHGFYVKVEVEKPETKAKDDLPIYKMYSHFGFTFETTDQKVFEKVYGELIKCLDAGFNLDKYNITDVGFFKKLGAR